VKGHPYSPFKLITGDLILKQQTVVTDISGLRSEEEGACTLVGCLLFSSVYVYLCLEWDMSFCFCCLTHASAMY
jgi:hypothetical protein